MRCRVQAIVGDVAEQPAQHVEDQVADVPQTILHVVPEDPQVPHVADEVKPPAVQEHGREERQEDAGGLDPSPAEYAVTSPGMSALRPMKSASPLDPRATS